MKDIDTNSLSKARLRLWLRLLTSSRTVEATLRERFRKDFDTTLPRFDVLSALDRHPDGLKMTELSRVLRVSNGNITGIIDRLTDDGFAERRSLEGDRRASVIRITKAGKHFFGRLAEAHEGWVNELLSPFEESDAAELAAKLKNVPETPVEEN